MWSQKLKAKSNIFLGGENQKLVWSVWSQDSKNEQMEEGHFFMLLRIQES